MMRRSKSLVIGCGLFLFAVNSLIILVALPAASTRISQLYSLNQYADGYDQLAANLAAGNGYRMFPDTARTLTREPGYPLLLAGMFILFRHSFLAVKLANVCFAFAAAWLMTRIAGKVSHSQVVVWGSPLLFLFHPGTLLAESRGGVEILFTFCLMSFLLTVYMAIERNKWSHYFLSGGLLGATVLVKSTPIFFPIFLLGYLLVVDRQVSKWVICRRVAIMVIAMFVLLSPWIIRNYSLTGEFVPTATVLGISADAGLYDVTHVSIDKGWAQADTDGAHERRRIAQELGYPFKDIKNAYYQEFYSSIDEVRFSNYLLKRVIAAYASSPSRLIRFLWSNSLNFWFRGKTWKSTVMNVILQLPYLILAIIGIVLAVMNHDIKAVAPMSLLVIYMMGVYISILAQARYSVPLMPCVSILACSTLAGMRRGISGDNRDGVRMHSLP